MSDRILLVEDEITIAEGLIFNLERKGYAIDHVVDGNDALTQSQNTAYNLIILDVSLPGRDGFSVCQELRKAKNFVPIIMLTARDQPDDVVYGLKCGADDYLTKPFDLAELLARVEGLLRRREWSSEQKPTDQGDVWEFGAGYQIDFSNWEAQTTQGKVVLSKKEIAVMKIFRDKINQVVSREELLDKVWQMPNHPNTRIVDNVIVTLRKHFEKDSANPEHIINMRGMGYKFLV